MRERRVRRVRNARRAGMAKRAQREESDVQPVLPIVLRPYKFSKSRPIKYRILAISHQKYAVKYRLLVINHQIVRIFEFIKYYWQHCVQHVFAYSSALGGLLHIAPNWNSRRNGHPGR
jgi:hypothetical protein